MVDLIEQKVTVYNLGLQLPANGLIVDKVYDLLESELGGAELGGAPSIQLCLETGYMDIYTAFDDKAEAQALARKLKAVLNERA